MGLTVETLPDRCFGPRHDRFCLGALLNKGGQGKVYECMPVGPSGFPCSSGKRFAAKVIDLQRSVTPGGDKNLRREIRTLQELHHPRIVNLHEAFWEDDECIIVMDLASGGDLHSKISQEKWEQPAPFHGLGRSELCSKHVARQLFDGLGYMHSNSVLHRDLKLENILIAASHSGGWPSSDQQPLELLDVKIADFGMSRFLKRGLQRANTLVGTPDYIAPEVLERCYDDRADMWSLGVLLYAMLCGEFPFRIDPMKDLAPGRHIVAVAHIRETPSWLLASEHAQDIVSNLLRLDPAERLSPHGCSFHPWAAPEGGADTFDALPGWSPRGMGPSGVVRQLTGRTGAAVDSVRMLFWSGCLEQHGGAGGDRQLDFTLAPDELIVAIMQEERSEYLGNALVFYTSAGRTLSVEGSDAYRWNRFAAPAGGQIVGLHFNSSNVSGVYLEDVAEPASGAVECIGGRVGFAVDSVALRLRKGKTREYGTQNGDAVEPFELRSSELLIGVEQGRRGAFLGSSLVFYTSEGRIFELQGVQPCQALRFVAPAGSQICGLTFEGSRLAGVATCPDTGDMSQARAHSVHV